MPARCGSLPSPRQPDVAAAACSRGGRCRAGPGGRQPSLLAVSARHRRRRPPPRPPASIEAARGCHALPVPDFYGYALAGDRSPRSRCCRGCPPPLRLAPGGSVLVSGSATRPPVAVASTFNLLLLVGTAASHCQASPRSAAHRRRCNVLAADWSLAARARACRRLLAPAPVSRRRCPLPLQPTPTIAAVHSCAAPQCAPGSRVPARGRRAPPCFLLSLLVSRDDAGTPPPVLRGPPWQRVSCQRPC